MNEILKEQQNNQTANDKGSVLKRLVRPPSDFTKYPWSSILQCCESEIVAQNIMKILKRTGNTFRDLNWEEYEAERVKDKGFTPTERGHFDKVIEYCKNADTAKRFSKEWA